MNKKLLPIIIAVVAVIIIAVVAVVLITGNDTPVEKDYNLSIGVVTTPALTDSEVSETVAAVVTDADGKIVLCRFDCIEFAAKYTDGALDTTAPTSKVAQGEAYDSYRPMAKGTWYVQADALAANLVGKTQTEVSNIALNDEGKLSDTDLAATCSIAVGDLLKAVDNAFKSEHKTTFKSTTNTFTAGVAVIGSVSDTANDTTKNAKFSTDFAASVLVDGKVVASILDSAEISLNNITDDGAADYTYAGTKREQGDNYDKDDQMKAGEWYVQADAYALAANGKTATDIDTLAADGVAGCTIYAGGYKQVIAAAVKAAK